MKKLLLLRLNVHLWLLEHVRQLLKLTLHNDAHGFDAEGAFNVAVVGLDLLHRLRRILTSSLQILQFHVLLREERIQVQRDVGRVLDAAFGVFNLFQLLFQFID